MRITATMVLVSLAASAGLAGPVATLEPFAGSFRGEGSVKRTAGDASESVRCRITSGLGEDGLSLDQSGSCAVPGQKVTIESRIVLDPASNRLTGSWTDPSDGSAATVSGRLEGDRMVLTIVGRDPKTLEARTRWMVLEPTGTGYRLTSTAADPRGGGRFVAGSIEFTR
jgi:hypothetical protein